MEKERKATLQKQISPLKALRKYCLSCCVGQYNEVRLCPAVLCPVWAYRFGRIPKPKPELTVLKSIRGRCLDCSGFSQKDVRECWNVECFLYPFRMGHNPNIRLSDQEKERRAKQLRESRQLSLVS